MANTYNWKINKLEVVKSKKGLANVVSRIHYKYTATSDQLDSNGNNYEKSVISVCSTNDPVENEYIDFDNLQEANVVNWLENLLDIDSIKQNLDNQLLELINPTKELKSVPW